MIPAMRKASKPSLTESPLLFEVDPEPSEEMLTALGGTPLVVQAFRSWVDQDATIIESRKQRALPT